MNEIKVLQYCDHPNIVKLIGVYSDKDRVYLVLEYVEGESLLSYLKTKLSKRPSDSIIKEIFLQILNAMNYLHENGIAHRDIKLENILIQKDSLKIKIIDFGFAIKIPDS